MKLREIEEYLENSFSGISAELNFTMGKVRWIYFIDEDRKLSNLLKSGAIPHVESRRCFEFEEMAF